MSQRYLEQLRILHSKPGKRRWGTTAETMVDAIVEQAHGRTQWLDYGAGSGGLVQSIRKNSWYRDRYHITEYEPSRPDAQPPQPAEFVVCVDVLEHVEPEYIGAVLDDLQRVTVDRGYFTISCQPALTHLPDGRNAHLIVEKPDWWVDQLVQRFRIPAYQYRERSKRLLVTVESYDLPEKN